MTKLELLKLEIPGRVKKMCRPPEMIDMPKLIKKGEDIVVNYDKIIYFWRINRWYILKQ